MANARVDQIHRARIIETLATGDEVVAGDVVDSNSAFVSRELGRRGCAVQRHTALPDDRVLLSAEIRAIAERADLCISSGGMGPTEDDLTAEVVSDVLGVPLGIDAEALARMKERFARFGMSFTENNTRSARVPQGAHVIQNEVGSAPAFSVRIGRCLFFFLPGVPSEFRFFVTGAVVPAVEAMPAATVTLTRQLKTLGWPESHLAAQFTDFAALFPEIKLGYRAHAPETWLKLTATAATRAAVEALIAPAEAAAMERIGLDVFGTDDDELPVIVAQALKSRRLKLVAAESCTGGRIAAMLTALPGSSEIFEGSLVTYRESAKQGWLGISAELLAAKSAVSREVARAMAEAALSRGGADIAVSVTGVAGPGGGTTEIPVGTVYFALVTKDGQIVELTRRFRGDRDRVQRAATATALEMVRRALAGADPLLNGQG